MEASELTGLGSVLTAAGTPCVGGGGGGGQNTLAPLSGDGSVGNPIQIAPANTGAAGSMSAAQVQKLNALLRPVNGINLANINSNISPAVDKASQYIIPAGTLTANRTCQLNSGSMGLFVRIVREDLSAHTYTIINGGVHAAVFGTIFQASPSGIQAMTFVFNGTDWVFLGFEYLQST